MMGASALQQMAFPRYRSVLATALFACMIASGLPAEAQPSLRSTFPGRRIGGATRGECSSRLIAHLVPADSVYASGESRLLAILQGPSLNPQPLQLSFSAAAEAAADASTTLLPASGVGLVLFRQPATRVPLRWVSSYQCEQGSTAASDDPLAFVSAGSPPAISLLLAGSNSEFLPLQKLLQQISQACGGTVSRDLISSRFGFTDLIKADWPAQLPVRCVF
jgi:hypothetical protein